MTDLFIAAGEMSGDLHGSRLIQQLLALRPDLKISAVAGPKMRQWPIREAFPMERLRVMGFIDVLFHLPTLIRSFFFIRNEILKQSPKTVVFIDYPGFHLRMQRSLRKKGFQGALIHYICPTVWAWGKKRIPLMAQHLDLLLTIFPFETECFAGTNLPVKYTGHPLADAIFQFRPGAKFQDKILALFPGSRKAEIERNLPLQLEAARRLQKIDPSLKIAISKTQFKINVPDALIVEPEDHYELMRGCRLAIATSGTVALELALHGTPTIVTYAIRRLDCWIAQKIFKINLPFYAMPNIIANKAVFPELFGPNLNAERLFFWAHKLWTDPEARSQCIEACREVRHTLGSKNASLEAAQQILSKIPPYE